METKQIMKLRHGNYMNPRTETPVPFIDGHNSPRAPIDGHINPMATSSTTIRTKDEFGPKTRFGPKTNSDPILKFGPNYFAH